MPRVAKRFVAFVGASLLISLASATAPAWAQSTRPLADTVVWTTADDHRHMLEQLGIRRLRPGPTADASAPNAANYDEAKANPYPLLPDPLTLRNGTKVATADAWWSLRRAEIIEDFEREVVGRVPQNVPGVDWSVVAMREWDIGGRRVVGRQLVGQIGR